MNIIKQNSSDGTIKLIVYSLDTKDKIKEFLGYIQDISCSYEISFLNMQILPLEVLLQLNKIKQNLKIYVNEKKLKYYFLDLGFDTVIIDSIKATYDESLSTINYIALGGSAGSLDKFIDIVKYLPASKLTLFIIMHQKSDVKSPLEDILQKYTVYYKVKEAKDNMYVEPSTIYIAPPNKHMIVLKDFIFLTDDKPKHFSRPSISVSFESLAHEYKQQLMVILVCGYGADGSDSLKIVREYGGVVIIEQLYECVATAMLENGINTKEFDKILSLNDISILLYDKIKKDNSIEIHLVDFLEQIYQTYGYDYRDYHKKHIIRRIEYSYKKLMSKSFEEFKQKVLTDKSVFQQLFLDISVNVTTFFRDPTVYKELKKYFKKYLVQLPSIKIWCAGCSSGEEPYSIAILLKELGVLDKSLIYATDINEVVLQFAKNGAYSLKSYHLFEEYYKKANGDKNFSDYFVFYDNFVTITDELKKNVLFFRHNLATDGVLNQFQLIICRNVIIYFNKDLTMRVFDLFNSSLEDNGLLVLGESERFYNNYNYTILDQHHKIYLK